MNLGIFFSWSIVLFAIIYISVRLAISPLLDKKDEIPLENGEYGLFKLRDMAVLSTIELEEIIKLYKSRRVKKEDYERYQRYEKVLNELKEMGYFSDDQYSIKINKLKRYFKVD
jgi:saccharopine dehydrogenase-like NADP-dependent oxidoreductase